MFGALALAFAVPAAFLRSFWPIQIAMWFVLFWGGALGLVVASMLILGGIDALQTTMIIGALPFSAVVALMAIALIKAIAFDVLRKRQGVATHCETILATRSPAADPGLAPRGR